MKNRSISSRKVINVRRGPGRPKKWLDGTVPVTIALPTSALARMDQLIEEKGFKSRTEFIVAMIAELDKKLKRDLIEKIEETQRVISSLMKENKRQNELLQKLLSKFKPDILISVEVPEEIEEIVSKFESKWKEIVKRMKEIKKETLDAWVDIVAFEVEKEVMKRGFAVKDWKTVKLYIRKKLYEWWGK